MSGNSNYERIDTWAHCRVPMLAAFTKKRTKNLLLKPAIRSEQSNLLKRLLRFVFNSLLNAFEQMLIQHWNGRDTLTIRLG